MEKTHLAGLLFLLAGSISLMGIITAESLISGYSTADNAISDLGVIEGSAIVFNATMMLAGATGIAGVFLLFKVWGSLKKTVPLFLFGVGTFGVGLFPENHVLLHLLFALVAFFFAAVTAISAYFYTSAPFRYASVCIGVVSLISLFSYLSSIGLPGSGGTERWVVYPAVLWLACFGGYLMGQKTGNK
jgi:hypothetical membrane protein